MGISCLRCVALCGASVFALSAMARPAAAQSTGPAAPAPAVSVAEVVVTAEKRTESINKVGMSIQAETGDHLLQLGITTTADLTRVVTGLTYTPSFGGTPIYTIRGVGFQENSLAASPTVSIYRDETPIPYSIEAAGAPLDPQRVEVLKGPQGTLFGENATGGAINYIAAKPTDHPSQSFDVSYGRFNHLDAEGFVSGPITDTLDYRLAAKVVDSDGWQKNYVTGATSGDTKFYELRGSLLWKPTSRFTALLTLEGWIDNSDAQQAQLFGIDNFRSGGAIDPRILAFPRAPHNDQAASWSACVNTSPLNQPFNTTPPPYGYPRPTTPTHCTGYAQNNRDYNGALRLDYDLGGDVVLTSLTSYQRFDRYTPLDLDGATYQDFEELFSGRISTIYQELRLAGKLSGKGSWLVGGNIQHDESYDSFLNSYEDSSTAVFAGNLLGPTRPEDSQHTNTYAVFGDMSYPILADLTAQGGMRLTETDRAFDGCVYDSGDGTIAAIAYLEQELLGAGAAAVKPSPGGCSTLSNVFPFNPPSGGVTETLDEKNVSWRAGLNYTAIPGTLLYANVSQGYKAGSFPTINSIFAAQLAPARQERLIAYEAGFKSRLLDDKLQLDGAFFYYDYKDKQILGETVTLFGPLPELINVPKSHVIGGELSATWRPLPGLTITPGISYAHSEIDGDYFNYTPFGELANFKGQSFPQAPPLTSTVDAQYSWTVSAGLDAYVGADANYTAGTRAFLVNQQSTDVPVGVLDIPQRTLIDLRAGLVRGSWTLQLWGRNVTNQYYWTDARAINDVLVRYAGMPATFGLTVIWKH